MAAEKMIFKSVHNKDGAIMVFVERLLDIIDRFSQLRPIFLIKRHAHKNVSKSLFSTSILLQVTDRHLNVFLENVEYYKS